MKKRTLLIIVFVMSLCIGWWVVEKEIKFKNSKEATISYMKDRYHKINEITITQTELNPVGYVGVNGYVNNDTSLTFTVLVNPKNYRVSGLSMVENFETKIQETN